MDDRAQKNPFEDHLAVFILYKAQHPLTIWAKNGFLCYFPREIKGFSIQKNAHAYFVSSIHILADSKLH